MLVLRAVLLVLLALAPASLGVEVEDAPMHNVIIRPNVSMPIVGLGSCCGTYNVAAWIALGYRHIDTSCDYGSQPTIGAAVRASGVPRSHFFITSKINPENYGPDVSGVLQEQVLGPLGMDYVDLLLMHHAGRPQSETTHPACFTADDPRGTYYTCRIETYRSMMQLQSRGLVRAIGVSNWEVRELEQLFNATGQYPAVNQIEHHPSFYTPDLIAYCRAKGISITAYAPQGAYPRSNDVYSDPVASVAVKRNRSPGQVMLRWALQAGADTVVPRSKNTTHMLENVNIFNFTLLSSDMDALAHFPQRKLYNTQCQPWC